MINVLSLFDGCSCAFVALKNLGIDCTYYASEIDKYAITVSNQNDIIQIGDIRLIDNITLNSIGKIDLLIGGSPCTGFSSAGKMEGLGNEQSKLFFEFVRVLNLVKPRYFVFENVRVNKSIRDIISGHLKVDCIELNSSLVSAQNRVRLYWTNLKPNIKKNDVTISDIITKTEYNLLNYIESEIVPMIDKSIKPSVAKFIQKFHNDIINSDKDFYTMKCKSNYCDCKIGLRKTPTIRANNTSLYILDNNKVYRKITITEAERLQTLPDNYTEGVSYTQRWKMIGNGFTVKIIEGILYDLQ